MIVCLVLAHSIYVEQGGDLNFSNFPPVMKHQATNRFSVSGSGYLVPSAGSNPGCKSFGFIPLTCIVSCSGWNSLPVWRRVYQDVMINASSSMLCTYQFRLSRAMIGGGDAMSHYRQSASSRTWEFVFVR